jgi:hypothetical protein
MAVGLTIDGQSFDIEGAWKHNRSLRRLRSTIQKRGENQVVMDVAGRSSYDVVPDEVVVDLELTVSGSNSHLGVPFVDQVVGLDTNLAYLDDWVADHNSTYAAALETPSGATYTADVQIINWQVAQEHAVQVVMSYDLRVTSALWVPT